MMEIEAKTTNEWKNHDYPMDGSRVLLALDIGVGHAIVVVGNYSSPMLRNRWEASWNGRPIPDSAIIAWHPIPPGAENFLPTQEELR